MVTTVSSRGRLVENVSDSRVISLVAGESASRRSWALLSGKVSANRDQSAVASACRIPEQHGAAGIDVPVYPDEDRFDCHDKAPEDDASRKRAAPAFLPTS